MSRAFRARPLDVNKQLELILDINELDSAEGLPARDVVHNHAQLDADNEKVRLPAFLLVVLVYRRMECCCGGSGCRWEGPLHARRGARPAGCTSGGVNAGSVLLLSVCWLFRGRRPPWDLARSCSAS